MSKIKVLHVIKSLGRGGAEMLLPATLSVHDTAKFEFHYIYFLPWKDQMVAAIRDQGGDVSCFPASNNLLLILKVRAVARYCKDHGIQLIHAHLPWAGILSRIVGKISGVPIIYTEHNKQERYHPVTRTLNLFTMRFQKRVIAVSDDVAQSIFKNKSNLKVPVQTVLNGVNTIRFAPDFFNKNDVRTQYNIPADAIIIGTIAVFRFQKRLDVWLDLARSILDKRSNVHFIIVGDGPLKNMLMEKVGQLDLTRNVHFSGLKEEVRPYLAQFDIYMMTSSFEGLPIALLEAMSSGCPVISTDAGGIKEVIRHEKDGLICNMEHPAQLISYALQLIDDPVKRKQIGMNARIRVQKDFSIETMVKQLENVYHEEALK